MRKVLIAVLFTIMCAMLAGTPLAGNEGGVKQPGKVNLGDISEKYGPVQFDHSMHVSIAGNCGSCHHEHPAGAAMSCEGCHSMDKKEFKKAVSRGFMPCNACHGVFDAANPSIPSLKAAYHRQCFQCHKGMGGIGEDPKGCTVMCHDKKA